MPCGGRRRAASGGHPDISPWPTNSTNLQPEELRRCSRRELQETKAAPLGVPENRGSQASAHSDARETEVDVTPSGQEETTRARSVGGNPSAPPRGRHGETGCRSERASEREQSRRPRGRERPSGLPSRGIIGIAEPRSMASLGVGRHTNGLGDSGGIGPSEVERRGGAPRSNPTCMECSGLVIEGHRVVNLRCGHVIHARCVLSNPESGGERALLGCKVKGCRARHHRREP